MARRDTWLSGMIGVTLSVFAGGCSSDNPGSLAPGVVGATSGTGATPGTPSAGTSAAGTAAAAGTSSAAAGTLATTGGTGGAGKSASARTSATTPAAGSGGAPAGGSAGSTTTAGSGGSAAGATAAGSGGSSLPVDPNSTGPFPPVTDFQANGPYKSTTINTTGPNNNYTVYLPTELAPNGTKNPIVGWMSGGSTTPSGYTLLPHLATHGFVVVASNTAPGIGEEVDLGKEIIAGIDWAIAENDREGSMLKGKLDTTLIASMGYSMGSLATFTIANDPRLVTTVHISGGNMAPERVDNLHAPAAFICGIPGDANCNILSNDCDIAAANCDIDFMNAKTPVFYANFPGGHLGVLTDPNMTRIRGVATAWLRWKLMADNTLSKMFVGDQCTLCSDANWKVKQKNL